LLKRLSLSPFDKQCLEKLVVLSKKAMDSGNYPVAALIAIDDQILGSISNSIFKKQAFTNHAEHLLIMKYDVQLFSAFQENKKSFSTVR